MLRTKTTPRNMSQQVNKARVQTSFAKRLYSYNQHAEAQAYMAEELIERLRQIHPDRFARVLEIGCGTGILTERFLKTFSASTLYANDLVEECGAMADDIFRQYPDGRFAFIGGDIERIDGLPDHLDLILSGATFQWLHDLGGFLTRIKPLLTANGLLAFSTFGTENLSEIRALTGNTLSYLSREEICGLLRERFEVLTCAEERVTLHFPSPTHVLRHLRLTGVNGLSSQKTWTKSDLAEFDRAYRERFETHNRVPLTYHPIFCLCRR